MKSTRRPKEGPRRGLVYPRALQRELEKLLPDVELVLPLHRLSLKGESNAPQLTQFGVLVTRRAGPFTLRREYLVE